jgi:outer membrane lipase/esterase
MPKVKLFALLAALAAITILKPPGRIDAAGFDQFFAFGDSTLDTGYFINHPSGNPLFDSALQHAMTLGATGGFAGNGVMNTTILADKFGLTIAPLGEPGGTNYANGGATTVVNPASMVPNNVCTILQIQNYLASVGGVANPNAVYLIKSGDNDVTFYNSQTAQWRATYPNYLSDGAMGLTEAVASLQAAGARTIIVRNSYDSALFATWGGDILPSNAADYARSRALMTWEWSYLQTRGVRFIPADNDSLFRYIAHNPTRFGFTARSVLADAAPNAWPHVTACFDILTPEQQRDYLFIDGVHLTTAGQTIEADYSYSLLVAPSEISLLAESAVQVGWAHAATIQGQLDPCGRRCRPRGRNVWTSAGAYSLNTGSAPGFVTDSGTPFGGTVGLDYQTENGLIFGAAFTTGSQSPAFSTGGHFSQVDEAPSLYAGYNGETWWGNAVATYDMFQYDVRRSVQLGILNDQNYANTTGHSLGVAFRGGRNVSVGRYTTGPVAGVVIQEVQVNGFTETGDTGITALSFGHQSRSSFVTQLGWRVCMDGGRLRPFAEANWNHECAGRDREITTTLTTVGAPSYTMDAVQANGDWATTSLGTYYELSPRAMLRASASAMYANPQMTTCGGEVGLNYSF